MDLNLNELLFGSTRRLAHTGRYASIPVIMKESVAEHTCFTALYAFCIASDLQSRGIKVDPNLAAVKALVHDLEEAETGDQLRMFKYSSVALTSAINDAANDIALNMSKRLGLPLLYDRWRTSKDFKTLEGQVVALSDILSVFSYLSTEYKTGNTHAVEVLGECLIRTSNELLPKLDPEIKPYLEFALSATGTVLENGPTSYDLRLNRVGTRA